MPLTKQGNFSFNHVDQQDDIYKVKSALEIKTAFDSRASDLKTTLNALIDSLKSTAVNDSGAENIAIEPINGVTGANVQSALEDLRVKINSAVAGAIPDGSITKTKLDPAMYVQLIDYAATTGAANTYAIALTPAPTSYTDGMAVSVRINADSSGTSTLNINGLGAKALKKANGNDVTNLKTNGVYTFRYNSTTGNFILQGEGGSGTATAPDILTGKTASTDAGDLTGTMTDRGAMTITPGTTDQVIPSGFHNGSGKVVGDVDLIAANILNGKNIFGVDGSLVLGKKFASGTVTSSNNLATFSMLGGSSTNMYPFTVSGITFKPTTIVYYYALGSYQVMRIYSTFYPFGVLIANQNVGETSSNGTTSGGSSPVIAGGALSVTATGFTLPLDSNASASQTTVNWFAIE